MGARARAVGVVGGGEHAKLSGFELTACIAADLCPHGMLPLAWAAAAGGGTGIVPTLALLAAFGGASTYTLWLSAAMSEANGSDSNSLSSVWRASGLPWPKAVDALVATLCGGCCVFYCAFAADLFRALAPSGTSRAAVLAALGAVVAPLCLGDDLSVLKYSSYAGLAGAAYTAGLLGLRGARATTYAAPSAFRVSSGTAVLANTLVVAYLCHYNALQYYHELAPSSPSSSAVPPRRYAAVAARSVLVTTLVFGVSLFGGRAAFAEASLPNVLNNFGRGDAAAGLAKLGTGVAIVSGFPLMFAGLKAALAGVVDYNRLRPKALHAALLVVFGIIANASTDRAIGLVIELLGSTLGVAAVYIVPGLAAARASNIPKPHRDAGAVLASCGALFGLFGTALTLKTHFAHDA